MQIPFGANVSLFLAACALLTTLCLRDSRAFLFSCGIAISLLTPSFAFGVNLNLPFVVGPIGVIGYLIRPRMLRNSPGHRIVAPFLVYATLVTIAWMIPEYLTLQRYRLPEEMGLGIGQAFLKMPAQLAVFLAVASVFYLLPLHAKSVQEVEVGILGYVFGCIASAGAGLLLLVSTGQGFLGANADTPLEVGGASLIRLGGLSGEPKHLGALLVQALALLLPALIGSQSRAPRRLWVAAALCLWALFFTLSTSAWYGFALVLVFTVVRSRRPLFQKLAVFAAVGALVLVASQIPLVQGAVHDRIVTRTIDSDTSEVGAGRDTITLAVLDEKPTLFIFGFGLGGADLEAHALLYKLPQFARELDYVRTPTPSAMGLRLFGDTGLVGLTLLLIAALKADRLVDGGSRILGRSAVVAFAGLMACTQTALPAFFFILGGIYARHRLAQKERLPQDPRSKAGHAVPPRTIAAS